MIITSYYCIDMIELMLQGLVQLCCIENEWNEELWLAKRSDVSCKGKLYPGKLGAANSWKRPNLDKFKLLLFPVIE